MARNLRKGSKVYVNIGHRNIRGIVTKKFTARKGSVNVPYNKRTIVHVKASGQLFTKSPNQLRRRTRVKVHKKTNGNYFVRKVGHRNYID